MIYPHPPISQYANMEKGRTPLPSLSLSLFLSLSLSLSLSPSFDSFRTSMEKGADQENLVIIYVYTVVNPPPDNSGHMQINSRP